jgi:hypothetical protein
MLAFGTGLNEETLRSQVRQSATIIVTDSGTDYLLQSMSLPATRIAKPDVSSDSCRIFSEEERLGNLGAIKAVYIQAFNDVMRYRATHSWPLGAASTNPAQVDVLAAAYGPYVVIWLLDNFLHRDSSGKVELGCSGHENYRVQTATSEVLPFDDCVESHTAVFPALSQLPQ